MWGAWVELECNLVASHLTLLILLISPHLTLTPTHPHSLKITSPPISPPHRSDRILHTAVHDHILPALRQEVESDLERQSADHVACEAGGVFWRYATQPPIAVATTEDPADPRPLDVRLVKASGGGGFE